MANYLAIRQYQNYGEAIINGNKKLSHFKYSNVDKKNISQNIYTK